MIAAYRNCFFGSGRAAPPRIATSGTRARQQPREAFDKYQPKGIIRLQMQIITGLLLTK
jgi:hypothetical protein